ncbi:hypothetical protein NVP1049O_24 [Vibrio phage 1.049.O._10N.286.54.B5]|nr:hypothetical protein NVP1049O_24 [Vibrio phage 1.049.O._10N.286.54.B5]
METLRFSEPWVESTSPLDLAFTLDPDVIKLRFTETWVASRSPIKLRFEGEIPPEPPIDNGALGIQVGLVWDEALWHEIQTSLITHSDRVATETSLDWLSKDHTETQTSVNWVTGYIQYITVGIPLLTSNMVDVDTHVRWETPELLTNANVTVWGGIDTIEIWVDSPWYDTDGIGIDSEIKYGGSNTAECMFNLPFSSHDSRGNDISVKWGDRLPGWNCSTKYRPPAVGLFSIRFSDPWVTTNSPVTLRFTKSPEYCEYDPGGGIINPNPDLPDLDFKVPIDPQIRRVYLMEPTLTCKRVSDNLVIVINSVSISDRRGQHTKSINIEFSSKIDAKHAENELLIISINGYDFYALAETPTKREIFGSATYSSGGRSRTATLAEPWMLPISYTNTVSRSLAGLLGDMLENTGWSIQLEGIDDFNVPTGAFSISGKSPIDSVSDAVKQLGCMTIADEFTSVIKVVPQWPTAPWAMGGTIPDANIHDAVIIDYNSTEQINKLCNGIWIRGEQHGISARVKRTGTAGDILTQDKSSQLIVDVQAARVAGTVALADTGKKEQITINLPIMADLPPLTKGMLVGVTYRSEVFKATLDSVSITASMSDSEGLDVNQSIVLIRHLE